MMARLTFAAIYMQLLCKITNFSTGLHMITQACSAGGNGLFQHLPDRSGQIIGLGFANPACFPARSYSRQI
jgi:hypothetical protein